MEMLVSTSPDLKPPLESVAIPLTAAMRIFTKKLENRCTEIKHKDLPSNLVTNAKSACDRYNFLVHNDIKDSQGICGIVDHWIIGSDKEWRNELDEIRQKEIEENTLKIPQNKQARKKQNKWIQGPLESRVERPMYTKRKSEQEVEHVEIEEQQKKQENKISWADDAEIVFGDVEPQQTVDSLNIGNVESKESIRNNKRVDEMNDEQDIRALGAKLKQTGDNDEENRQARDLEFAEMNDDDNEEDLLTPNVETSDKDVQIPSEGKNHSQDDVNASTVSEYLLKYVKVIYNALLTELESRQLLYEIDQKPRVSECPTGREKKRGQKKRKYENKLLRHSILIKSEGLAIRRNN
ncbi:17257_t:CDS:2, partial [Cetraspora pellucida]